MTFPVLTPVLFQEPALQRFARFTPLSLPAVISLSVSDTFPPSSPVYGKGQSTQEIKQLPTAVSRALRLVLSSREPLAVRLHPWKCLTRDSQLGDDVNQMWSLQRATQGGTQHGWGLEVASG